MNVELVKDQSVDRIFEFLNKEDDSFIPPLSSKVNLVSYSTKLSVSAINIFACIASVDVGHVAFYSNDKKNFKGFLSSICLCKNNKGSGVGILLLNQVFEHCLESGMKVVELEVDVCNMAAIRFYEKHGFGFTCD
ncbi:MAG: GNAT family N-acetyltransferase, partial [Pseudohongiella sp.]|nr:GNAT family N-acetyltransferase [Pseudohongiella sp.]